MGLGDQAGTAGEDEILQRAQLVVPAVDAAFQACHFRLVQGPILRHRQLPAEVEQAVLHRRQRLDDLLQAGM